MICVYDIGNNDFDKNGDAVLTPTSGKVRIIAAGNYSINIVHPIDPDGKWEHLVPGAIVKAPVPREVIENSFSGYSADIYKTTVNAELRQEPTSPTAIVYPTWDGYNEYTVGTAVSVANWYHRNYICNYFDTSSGERFVPPYNSAWWSEIADTADGAPVLVTLPAGTELYFVEDVDSSWYKMSTYFGLVGYILKSAVTFDRHVDPTENQPRIITEQLFRLQEPDIDNEANTVTVNGQHVSYDLSGVLVNDISIAQASPALAIGKIMENMMIPYRGTIATNMVSNSDGTYTGETNGKNAMFMLMDPDKGIVHTFDAKFTRDNWDLFIMTRTETDRGYRIRYGKNARGIHWKRSSAGMITRVVPVAKTEGGEDLFLPEKWVDSPLISAYPVIIMERIKVDGQVGKDDGTGTDTVWTESALLDHMRQKAGERFSIDHVDEITEEVTIQVEQLGDTAEYAWLKNLEDILIYDTVKAIDERIGLVMTLYVSELEWDIIRKKVSGLKLSNVIGNTQRTVTGYNVQNNSITAKKLTTDVARDIVQQAVDLIPEFADPNAERPSGNVVDDLTSTSATDALSANQGRVLNEKFADIKFFHTNATSGQTITLSVSNSLRAVMFVCGNSSGVKGQVVLASSSSGAGSKADSGGDTSSLSYDFNTTRKIKITFANPAHIMIMIANGTISQD